MTYRILSFMMLTALAAAGASGEALDLDRCIELGLANNLTLRNAKLKESAARETAAGARGMYDPFLSLDAGYVNSGITEAGSFISGNAEITEASAEIGKVMSSGTRVGIRASATSHDGEFPDLGGMGQAFDINPYSSRIALSLSQPILRNAFGRNDRAIVRLAQFGQDIAGHLYQRERNLLGLRIAEAYWNLYAAKASHTVGVESLDFAKTLLKSNRKRYEENLLDETDILAAEAVIETRTAEVTALNNIMRNAHDGLARTIQLPPEQWSKAPFTFPAATGIATTVDKELGHAERLHATAMRNRADLAALRIRQEQAQLDVRMKHNELKPALSVLGSLARGAANDTFGNTLGFGDTTWTVGVQFQTPLSRRREKSVLRKAELTGEAALNDLKNMEAGISLECRTAARTLQSARERLLASQRAVKLRKKRLVLENKKFDQGRSDIRWVIQSQDELARSQMAYHIALAQHEKARAACVTAQGTGPERRSP